MCTSIVANTNTSVLHGRNLDWGGIPTFGNITAAITFTKNGVPLYKAVHPVGFIGVLTGMRMGAFSVSLDERDLGGSLVDNVLSAITGGKSIGFFLRDMLATVTSFDDAVKLAASEQLISPSYIIIGGIHPGDGAIVTRDRKVAKDVWKMSDTPDKIFILETNYDHWLPAPTSDDRRDPGLAHMRAVGGSDKMTRDVMMQVMSMSPTHNDQTVFSAVMEVLSGYLAVTVWQA